MTLNCKFLAQVKVFPGYTNANYMDYFTENGIIFP